MPEITVIIPTYNREELIGKTLDSVASQSFDDFECLVIDDRSSDNTTSVVSNFCKTDPRFRLIVRSLSYPKGAPSCRNIGLSQAKGNYIQFFDSDDVLLPSALDDKFNSLSGSKELDFVVSRTAFLYEDGRILEPDQRLVKPRSFEQFLKNKTSFYTPGPLFRKSFLLSKEKTFEVGLKRHQEWEYYCRLMANMPHSKIIDKVHCHYRMHTDNIKAESDRLGNLYYRSTKLIAISYINKNTNYREASAIKNAFWPYGVTTLKVALYQLNPIGIIKTLLWLTAIYLNQFREASK